MGSWTDGWGRGGCAGPTRSGCANRGLGRPTVEVLRHPYTLADTDELPAAYLAGGLWLDRSREGS
jgi:hypothetical protein